MLIIHLAFRALMMSVANLSQPLLCGSVISFYPPPPLHGKIWSHTRLGNGVFIAISAINSLCVTVAVFTLAEVLAFKCQLVLLNWIRVL